MTPNAKLSKSLYCLNSRWNFALVLLFGRKLRNRLGRNLFSIRILLKPRFMHVLGLISAALLSSSAHSQWVIHDLGVLESPYSDRYNEYLAINASGHVVGHTDGPDRSTRGAYWADGFVGFLSTGGPGSTISGINSSDQLTGNYSVGYSTRGVHAFAYTDRFRDIGTFGGISSYGYGINDFGSVTGAANTPNGTHAFSWTAGGGIQDLGALGGLYSQGNAINAFGVITGGSTTETEGDFHAFVWHDGTMTDLGTLAKGNESQGNAINTFGAVTGFSTTQGYTIPHAFLSFNNQMIDLGTLGGNRSYGTSINSAAEVVGLAETSAGTLDAFLYSSGSMIDITTLIDGLSNVSIASINDAGDIFQVGVLNGEIHELKLSRVAVPEPMTISLLLSGLLLLLFFKQRNNRKGRQLRRNKNILLTLILIWGCFTGTAQANSTWSVTSRGYITSGFDDTGIFGVPSLDLTGLSFEHTITSSTNANRYATIDLRSYYNGLFDELPGNVFSDQVTVRGQTVVFTDVLAKFGRQVLATDVTTGSTHSFIDYIYNYQLGLLPDGSYLSVDNIAFSFSTAFVPTLDFSQVLSTQLDPTFIADTHFVLFGNQNASFYGVPSLIQLNVSDVSVAEPISGGLFALGFAALGFGRKLRRT